MGTYIASRVSDGNKLFPCKIVIDALGVTVHIPGFFRGEEKTIPFSRIASVQIQTALAAGYFIYGKTFIENSDHDSLRSYMEFSNHSNMSLVENLNLRFIDQFTDAEDKQTVLTKKYFTLLFKELNCSSVKFALCSEHFIVSVAIGGEYIGSVNFKANTGKFPNQDKFSGGQVIGIQDGCLKRSSLDFIEETIRKKYRPN